MKVVSTFSNFSNRDSKKKGKFPQEKMSWIGLCKKMGTKYINLSEEKGKKNGYYQKVYDCNVIARTVLQLFLWKKQQERERKENWIEFVSLIFGKQRMKNSKPFFTDFVLVVSFIWFFNMNFIFPLLIYSLYIILLLILEIN